jgi:lycopene epsilon-cyclase
VTYLNSKVDKIVESPDGHRVVCCERGREILCRLAIVASGAASGRLLEYEVGGPRVCVQTAYGVEVEVHRLGKLCPFQFIVYHNILVLVVCSFRMV